MALAAKGYLNDLVKMWELAIRSWVSWEFGDILFQTTQVQNQLAERLRSFHRELLALLQQKVGLHPEYLRAVLEKHQAGQRSTGNALDRSGEQLEKLLRKSQVHRPCSAFFSINYLTKIAFLI